MSISLVVVDSILTKGHTGYWMYIQIDEEKVQFTRFFDWFFKCINVLRWTWRMHPIIIINFEKMIRSFDTTRK
jgi:hypothetical protein